MNRIWKNLCVLLLVGTLIIVGTTFAASSDTQIDTNNLVDPQVNPTGVVNNQLGSLPSVNAYLKIDGIPGESTDKDHKDWIDLYSYGWGTTHAGIGPVGQTTGKANVQDFKFVMKVDKATPKLFLAAAFGMPIKNAVLEICRNGEIQQCFMKWTLTDVMVTSYQLSGSNENPTESVSFLFQKIEVEYRPMGPEGSLGEPIIASWDLKANKGG
jgi:type VI secretion system secreted protein Hcp